MRVQRGAHHGLEIFSRSVSAGVRGLACIVGVDRRRERLRVVHFKSGFEIDRSRIDGIPFENVELRAVAGHLRDEVVSVAAEVLKADAVVVDGSGEAAILVLELPVGENGNLLRGLLCGFRFFGDVRLRGVFSVIGGTAAREKRERHNDGKNAGKRRKKVFSDVGHIGFLSQNALKSF